MTKPNNDAHTPQLGRQHTTDAELLRGAVQNAETFDLPVDGPHRANQQGSAHNVAGGALTEGQTEAASPASVREADGWFGAQTNPATPPRAQLDGSAPQNRGQRSSVDSDPSDGDVSMNSELGEDLLGGEVVTDEASQQAIMRGGQPRKHSVMSGTSKQASFLDTLRGRVQEGVSELQERGEQLAFAGKLKLEQRSLESDREALFTRLGRAYFRRAEPDVLAVIENELGRVERDLHINAAQQEAHEQRLKQVRAERERPQVRYPTPEADVGTAFDLRVQPPRIAHGIETKERDTFFGLDRGGVDQAATVQGGNAAFDTTRQDADDHVLTIDELPDEEKN